MKLTRATSSTLAVTATNTLFIGWNEDKCICWSNTVIVQQLENGILPATERRHSDPQNFCDCNTPLRNRIVEKLYVSVRFINLKQLYHQNLLFWDKIIPGRNWTLICELFLENSTLACQASDLKYKLLLLQCHKNVHNILMKISLIFWEHYHWNVLRGLQVSNISNCLI